MACASVCEKVVFGSVLTDLADYEGEQDILAKDTIESASSGADSAEVVLLIPLLYCIHRQMTLQRIVLQ